MGNLAALKAKLQEIGYGDGDMVVGGVIAAEVIVHLTTADTHIDYDAALLIVQSLKLVSMAIWFPGRSYSLRMLNNYILLQIASRCVCVWGRYGFFLGRASGR